MAETVAAVPAKKVAKSSKPAKPRVKSSHPRTSDMVNAAIRSLNERSGSSLQAIKKYITGTYSIDAEKLAPFIKKSIKAGVASGDLVQTRGTGASGSFKLPSDSSKSKKKVVRSAKVASPKRAAIKKPTAIAAAKKTIVKKAAKSPTRKAAIKKPAAAAKKPAAKKSIKPAVARAAVKAKAPSKTKKITKSPAAKPKTPKPKKLAATKSRRTVAARK